MPKTIDCKKIMEEAERLSELSVLAKIERLDRLAYSKGIKAESLVNRDVWELEDLTGIPMDSPKETIEDEGSPQRFTTVKWREHNDWKNFNYWTKHHIVDRESSMDFTLRGIPIVSTLCSCGSSYSASQVRFFQGSVGEKVNPDLICKKCLKVYKKRERDK